MARPSGRPRRRCKTFLIDPPFLFTAGALLAFIARRSLVARKPNPFGPSAWVAVGFALTFWASVTYFVIETPDWMLNYFVPAAQMPMVPTHGLFALCLVLAALSGHTLAAVLLQRGRPWAAGGVLAGGLGVWFGLWTLTIDRYMVVGTWSEWSAGSAVPLTESSIQAAMNIVGIVQGFAFVVPALFLYRAGRRLRAA